MSRFSRVAATAAATLVLPLMAVPVATIGASAASAAPSASGTIVHIRGYNVWLVRPDGTGSYQVTRNGTYEHPYMSPSMSDNGIIAVGYGHDIVRMRQNGQVLNRMDPRPLMNSAGQPTDGPPVVVAISPDGARIAYTMVNYGCPIGTSCGARAVTGVTDSGALTPNRIGANYFNNPSWVTNRRLMTHGGYGSQMMLQDLGGAYQTWYNDYDVMGDDADEDLNDSAVSRDGTRLAAVRSYGENTHVVMGTVNGNVRTGSISTVPDPTYRCFTNSDEKVASPSWGPDNRTLVLSDSDGLVVIGEGSSCATTTFKAIARGGTEPHWSPAALSPGPRHPVVKPTVRPLKLVARPRVKGKAKVGKRLKATAGRWSPSPRSVQFRWLRNGKPIKGKAGSRKTYLVRRVDRGRKLQVRVRVTKPGRKAAQAVSAKVRVRR